MFVLCCRSSGLCDELITHSEESYRMCVSVGDLEASIVQWPGLESGCCATDTTNSNNCSRMLSLILVTIIAYKMSKHHMYAVSP